MEQITKSDLNEPILICTWEGWPDAAEAATKSIKELLSQSEVKHTINLNSESYYIYSDKRPSVTNINNKRQIDWLNNKFSFIKPKSINNDIIIFQGIIFS